MKRLRDALTLCRKWGFALDVGDLQHGINAVCAPVFGPDEKIIGCVILIGTFPEALIEKYGHKVTNTGKKISQKLEANVEQIYSSS